MNIVSTQYTLSQKALEIYISGCDGTCSNNCHNKELWDFNLGENFKTVLPSIINKIKESESMIDNIWILGGEPLLQDMNQFDILISELKLLNKTIWLFTRFEINEVKSIYKNYQKLDYIKCGKYDDKQITDKNIQFGVSLATKNQYIIKTKGEINNMDREQLYFAKIKETAIIPSKRDEDAGMDIYACFEEDNLVIQPHETKMIPTGIASSCDSNYYFQLFERGSTGTKGIGQRCGVIDSGYRNEWFIPITNHNTKPLTITKETNQETLNILSEDYIVYPYTKAIAQAVLLPVPLVNISTISYEELKQIKSERGIGHLGSSGK